MIVAGLVQWAVAKRCHSFLAKEAPLAYCFAYLGPPEATE